MYTCMKTIVSSKASRAKEQIMSTRGRRKFSKCVTTYMEERLLTREQASYITLENAIALYETKGINTIIKR